MVPKEVTKYVEVAVPYEKIVEIQVPVEKVIIFEDMFLLGIFIHHAIYLKRFHTKVSVLHMQESWVRALQDTYLWFRKNSFMPAHTDRHIT